MRLIVCYSQVLADTLQNYVHQSNNAAVLSKEQMTTLNHTLNEFSQSTDKKTGELVNAQFAVYITDSLKGSSIEDFS